MKTVLQIPLSKDLKTHAEEEALSLGFSSLQEIVRVFLTKLAAKKVEVALKETVTLSEKNEKRYHNMTKDFEQNKNIHTAKDADDLIAQLHESPLP